MPRSLRIVLLALLLPIVAVAQGEMASADISAPTPEFERFVLPGGLEENQVQQIVQDSTGYLWFGGRGGLHRYDGHQFNTYRHDPGDSTSISGNYVERLYVDSRGKLWVGTYGRGLNLFDPETEKFTRFIADPEGPKSLSHWACFAIEEDRHGNIWVGTANGLNRLEKGTYAITRFLYNHNFKDRKNRNFIREIHKGPEGNLWLGTGLGGITGTRISGLIRFDPITGQYKEFVQNAHDPGSRTTDIVLRIAEDQEGHLLIGAGKGFLGRFDIKGSHFMPVSTDPALASKLAFDVQSPRVIQPLITSILKDKEGCYWFSSDEAGLKRYNPRNGEVLHFTADSNGITNNRIVNIFQSRDGTIWVATGLKGEVFKTTSKEPVHYLTKGAFVFDEFKKTSIYQNLGKNAAHSRWVGNLLAILWRLTPIPKPCG
ncbi:MAG: hypothetical protein H6560_00565 [Lewinellaceae bacterium]|nr:hypothetical protein [Lewinellaceae bacterium]